MYRKILLLSAISILAINAQASQYRREYIPYGGTPQPRVADLTQTLPAEKKASIQANVKASIEANVKLTVAERALTRAQERVDDSTKNPNPRFNHISNPQLQVERKKLEAQEKTDAQNALEKAITTLQAAKDAKAAVDKRVASAEANRKEDQEAAFKVWQDQEDASANALKAKIKNTVNARNVEGDKAFEEYVARSYAADTDAIKKVHDANPAAKADRPYSTMYARSY